MKKYLLSSMLVAITLLTSCGGGGNKSSNTVKKDIEEIKTYLTTQFTTLAPGSETGNNIFHPSATDSPENSYLCIGK